MVVHNETFIDIRVLTGIINLPTSSILAVLQLSKINNAQCMPPLVIRSIVYQHIALAR